MEERGKEFWEEEADETRKDLRRATVRLVLIFVGILFGLGFVLWRSHAAIEFASSRIQGQTEARYHVKGIVKNARTGVAIPWPSLHDELDGKVLFQGSGKADGTFELSTVSSVHGLGVTAFGYRGAVVQVGRPWFTWLPTGSEYVEVRLTPE